MKKFLAIIMSCLTAVACCFAFTACGSDKEKLYVYTNAGFAPYEYVNEFGEVVGIDIDDDAVEQAQENISVSPWRERIKIEKYDFNEVFPSEKLFDLIVSNPPFYTEDTTCPNDSRQKARHATSLSIETMMKQASGMLTQEGRLSLIVPYSAATDVIGEAVMNNLYLSRRTDVRTTPTKPAKRTMLEFGRKAQPTVYDTLTLKDKEGNMSDEYKAMTEDFYL